MSSIANFTPTKRRIIHNKQTRNHNNNNTNKHDNVLLTTMYTLPKIYSPISHAHHQMNYTMSNINNKCLSSPVKHKKHKKVISDLRLNTVSSVRSNKDKQFDSYFKDKFYEDTKSSSTSRPGYKLMFEDHGLKNRVIHMKQVISFWKCLCEYTEPMFSMQHFNYVRANGEKKNKEDCYFHSIGKNYKRKRHVLYTNSCYQKMFFGKKVDKDKDKDKRLNLKVNK